MTFAFFGGDLAIPNFFLSAPVLDYWYLECISLCCIYPLHTIFAIEINRLSMGL